MISTAGVNAAGYSFTLEQFRKAAIKNAAVSIVMMIFRTINSLLATDVKHCSQLHRQNRCSEIDPKPHPKVTDKRGAE